MYILTVSALRKVRNGSVAEKQFRLPEGAPDHRPRTNLATRHLPATSGNRLAGPPRDQVRRYR